MECRINLIIPDAMRARHNVEIVEITPGKGCYCVIAPGHENQVPIVDSDRFVKSLVIVHTLKGEPIRRLNVMVIGFLKIGLIRRVLGIVLVRGKRGPVASRRDDLDND